MAKQWMSHSAFHHSVLAPFTNSHDRSGLVNIFRVSLRDEDEKVTVSMVIGDVYVVAEMGGGCDKRQGRSRQKLL